MQPHHGTRECVRTPTCAVVRTQYHDVHVACACGKRKKIGRFGARNAIYNDRGTARESLLMLETAHLFRERGTACIERYTRAKRSPIQCVAQSTINALVTTRQQPTRRSNPSYDTSPLPDYSSFHQNSAKGERNPLLPFQPIGATYQRTSHRRKRALGRRHVRLTDADDGSTFASETEATLHSDVGGFLAKRELGHAPMQRLSH